MRVFIPDSKLPDPSIQFEQSPKKKKESPPRFPNSNLFAPSLPRLMFTHLGEDDLCVCILSTKSLLLFKKSNDCTGRSTDRTKSGCIQTMTVNHAQI